MICLQLQGFDSIIFRARDKVKDFIENIYFGHNVLINNIAIFPTVFELSEQNGVSVNDGFLEKMKYHLQNLSVQFLKYFPAIEREDRTQDWITNAFNTTAFKFVNSPAI